MPENRAFIPSLTPGRMAPPMYRRCWSTTVTVVAVPMSKIMAGRGYSAAAAASAARMSAPNVSASAMARVRPDSEAGEMT